MADLAQLPPTVIPAARTAMPAPCVLPPAVILPDSAPIPAASPIPASLRRNEQEGI